jgi:tRNA(Ile2) C34 agmatinyltransferase TiaS
VDVIGGGGINTIGNIALDSDNVHETNVQVDQHMVNAGSMDMQVADMYYRLQQHQKSTPGYKVGSVVVVVMWV